MFVSVSLFYTKFKQLALSVRDKEIDIFAVVSWCNVRSRLILKRVLSYWDEMKIKGPVALTMWYAKKSTLWPEEEETLGSSPPLHVPVHTSWGKKALMRLWLPYTIRSSKKGLCLHTYPCRCHRTQNEE